MKLQKTVLALGVVFSGSALFSGCSDGSGGSVIYGPATAQLTAVTTPINVLVVDASGVPVTDVDFSVAITGTDKSKVVDALGTQVTTATTTGGALQLTLASGAVLPATFNVMVSAAGYLPTGKSVIVSATGSTIDVSVPIVKLATGTATTQADGSTVAPVTGAASGISGNVTKTPASAVNATGVVTAASGLAFKSPDTTAVIDSQVKLTVPSGVKMTDSAGAPITGTVTANVVSYSPNQDTALAAFPGGFAVDVARTSGATTSGSFVSGGFAAFNLVDGSGKTVKNFDQTVTASITVPSSTKNPDGSAIMIGQSMPIWSYDETVGKWVEEVGGTVARLDTQGNYVVEFGVKHLSYWNMDWFYGSTCAASVTVTKDAGASYVNLSAKFVDQKGYLYTGYADSSEPFKIYNAPANKPVDITMTVPGVAGSVTTRVADLCAGTVSLDATSLKPPVPGSMGGKVYEACFRNGVEVANTRRGLAAPVYIWGYSQSGQYVYRSAAATAAGAYSMTNLPVGSNYGMLSYSPRFYNEGNVKYYTYKYNQAVASGAATVSDFVFPMKCVVVSGVVGAAN